MIGKPLHQLRILGGPALELQDARRVILFATFYHRCAPPRRGIYL